MEPKPFSKSSLPEKVYASSLFAGETLEAVYQRIWNDLQAVQPLFLEKRYRADEAVRFAKGDQWTEEEKLAIVQQNRRPYVFDQVSSKVNALLGAHAVLRTDATAVAVEIGDEQAVAIQNRFIKWHEQLNRIETLEDQVFWDMVVEGAAATVTRWELTDMLSGRPVVERLPIRQMRWDARSVDEQLKDAKWMSRQTYMTKQEAIEMLPEWEEEINECADIGLEIAQIADLDILTDRQYAVSIGRDIQDSLRSHVLIVEHYERFKQTIWVVADDIGGEYMEFDKRSEAEDYATGLYENYMTMDESLLDENGDERIVVVPLKKDVIIQNMVIGDRCVSREVTTLPDFPYQIAFCYHHNGDYWSYVDLMIDPQRFLNRMLTLWDDMIGRSNKNMLLVKPMLLSTGFTLDHFNAERSKTSPTIPVKADNAVIPIPNPMPATDIKETILLTTSHMTDIVGGRNVLGLQENAAESGAAVRARQEAAGLSRLPIFSHLNYWRRSVTEMVLWYMKNYLPAGQQMRIIGKDAEVEYMQVDTEVLDTLANSRTDVIITESIDSETTRERQYIQLKELFQSMPPGTVPGDVMLAMMLEYSNLPQASKDKMMKMIESIKPFYEQQQVQQELGKMWDSTEKSVVKSEMKNMLEAHRATAPSANVGV